ncbi:thioredoxin [Coprobacter secundus]|uniref:Thioredoxin n=1 Tax=Coprobacter secundus subsp. similis TaxID=2751153 RepID=A0A7G1HVI7_9BACT|nr:thioredoxin [Coprobacter secundus]BCI63709.1 thioredoxin [Coprobacter secundus subsp. similis]CCY39027.1 thioredoxin [Tannerella sp. CAG:118]
MALKFTDTNVKNEINSGKLVVVDLWAEWCGPCRSITPSIEELATEYEGKAIIGKYNVDEENELSTEYGVRSIPTILFFKDGKLADKQVGASPKASIKAKIDALL